MATVDLGDGNTVDLGENPSPEMLERVRTVIETNKAKKGGAWETVKSLGADIARGFGRGVAGMAEGAAAFNSTERPSFKKNEAGQTVVGPSEDTPPILTEAVNKALPTPEDSSTARKYVRSGLEGFGGAVAGGGVTPTGLVSGTVGGIVGEAGDQMFGAPGRFLGTILGSVAGGVATAKISNARPQTANIVKEMRRGLTDDDLLEAAKYQAKMKAQGHDVDLAQALTAATESGGGGVTTVRNELAGSKYGVLTQKSLGSQPGDVVREAETMVAGLRGNNEGQLTNSNLIQKTATDVLQKIKQDRTDLWKRVLDKSIEEQKKLGAQRVDQAIAGATKTAKDLVTVHPKVTELTQNLERAKAVAQRAGLPTDQFDKQLVAAQKILKDVEAQHQTAVQAIVKAKEGANSVSTIPPDVLKATFNKLDNIIASHPPGSAEAKELTRLAKNLRNGEDMLNSPDQINQIFKQFSTRLKSVDLKTDGVDAGVSKYLGKVVGDMRKQLADGFVPMRKANQAFVDFTKARVDPLRQGPVGTLAQPHGYTPETQALVTKFDGLMNTGTDVTAGRSEIRTVAKELGKVNPEAFENAFKGWISKKVQGSLTSGTKELPLTADPEVIGRLYDTLFKSKMQWQGIKEATERMAVIRGENPEKVIRGLENLHSLTRAMRNSPGSNVGMSQEELRRLGSASATANMARIMSFLPANRLGEAIERKVLGETLTKLDTIVTSKNGAKMLIEISKVPVMSKAMFTILGSYGSMVGTQEEISDQNADGLPANNPPTN